MDLDLFISRQFTLAMNSLTVALTAGLYYLFAQLQRGSDRSNPQAFQTRDGTWSPVAPRHAAFLRLAFYGWAANFVYLSVEIIVSWAAATDASGSIPKNAKALVIATVLSLSIVGSAAFHLACNARSAVARFPSNHLTYAITTVLILLAVGIAQPPAPPPWLSFATASLVVAWGGHALYRLARAWRRIVSSTTSSTRIHSWLTYRSVAAYAALQFLYLLNIWPEEWDSAVPLRHSIDLANNIGFGLGMTFKLAHLVGLIMLLRLYADDVARVRLQLQDTLHTERLLAAENRALAAENDAVLAREATLEHGTELLAKVGHELGTPLTELRFSAESILRKARDPESVRRFAIRAISTANRISAINEAAWNILHGQGLAPTISDSKPPQKLLHKLPTLIEQAYLSVRTKSEEDADTGPKLRYRGLYPRNLYIECDAASIIQLFIILMTNSREATEQEEVEVCITLTRENPGNWARLLYEDTGPGVHPDIEESAFEPHISTKGEGRGRGLPIAREVAEAHSGSITHIGRSEAGGARFLLRLPATDPPATRRNQGNDDR